VDGLFKDFLLSCEVPSLDCLLLLDVSLGSVVFLLPFGEDGVALLDDLDGIIGFLLENLGDVDLSFHFVTNFIRNGFKNVFKLEVILVNVSRDSPDKLKTCK